MNLRGSTERDATEANDYFEVPYVPSAPGEYQPYIIGEAPLSCGFEPLGTREP